MDLARQIFGFTHHYDRRGTVGELAQSGAEPPTLPING